MTIPALFFRLSNCVHCFEFISFSVVLRLSVKIHYIRGLKFNRSPQDSFNVDGAIIPQLSRFFRLWGFYDPSAMVLGVRSGFRVDVGSHSRCVYVHACAYVRTLAPMRFVGVANVATFQSWDIHQPFSRCSENSGNSHQW